MHDQDVLIFMLVNRLYVKTKRAFLKELEDKRGQIQYTQELKDLKKKIKEEEEEKSSFLELAAHSRTVFKAKQY